MHPVFAVLLLVKGALMARCEEKIVMHCRVVLQLMQAALNESAWDAEVWIARGGAL